MAQHIGCKPGWTWKTDQLLEVIDCGACHVRFAIPEGMADRVQETGESFYCPNGCRISYSDTKVKRLRRERDAARVARDRARDAAASARAQADQAKADARAQKAAKTRIKNQRDRERERTAAGVCPCCGRTFKQLARHMERQHPDWPASHHD